MSVRTISPINALEFARMINAVKPPTGWSDTVTVANSGGSDSTCLLFLVDRYLKDRDRSDVVPRRLVSLTVDHNLQSSSAQMAAHAASIAESLGVQNITSKIPWGEGIYPRKPQGGQSVEDVARRSRYWIFFEQMKTLHADVVMVGHHADDQVETMLMRLARGSTRLGLAGMRKHRRFGMGDASEGSLGWRGHEGMRKWIVRPLLDVGKDRILATCEANKLEYVNDPTNFQPQFTIRNAIRDVISKDTVKDVTFADYPPHIAKDLMETNTAAANLPTLDFSLTSGLEKLREVTQTLNSELTAIDEQVDHILAEYRQKSPPGTVRMPVPALLSIDSPIVRQALLLRILRYVSPEPWGSQRSEIGRRQTSLQRLMQWIWDPSRLASKSNNSFSVGSGVWWRPIIVNNKNHWHTTIQGNEPQNLSWLACRLPNAKETIQNLGKPQSLKLDVTCDLKASQHAWQMDDGPETLEILYDRRFLLCFHLNRIPQTIAESLSKGAKITVEPRSAWFFPQIIHKSPGSRNATAIHTAILRNPFHWDQEWGTKKFKETVSGWITVEDIRSISAL
ncbi:PP-loop family-domain-containing protein [Crassisporium funariophilum]|nr:PP-loop family-domain-containing protein [Crassisporium funariophilum]